MKVLINTVNLKVGGALQRSVSFIQELKKIDKHEYHIFCTKSLSSQIKLKEYSENFKFYHFEESPASLANRRRIIKKFNELCNTVINPHVIFSFVGPAYWKPKQPHLVGFGIPHIAYSEYLYVKQLSLKPKLEMLYKKYWTKKEAEYFVVQTDDVKERLARKIKVPNESIFVVSNGFGSQYDDLQAEPVNNLRKKLLLISTFRPSKNFGFIKQIIPELKKRNFKCEFHVTIKHEDYEREFCEYKDWIINHGHVKANECPDLYKNCDAMFLPSFLECFSASYPEAMKMQRPILTSNLSFAKSICQDAALYFDPFNPSEAADQILKLFSKPELYKQLVSNGTKRLEFFDGPTQRAEKYINILERIYKDN